MLLGNLPDIIAVPDPYIPTRYLNGLEQAAPTEFYTRREAEEAIDFRQRVLDFCARFLS